MGCCIYLSFWVHAHAHRQTEMHAAINNIFRCIWAVLEQCEQCDKSGHTILAISYTHDSYSEDDPLCWLGGVVAIRFPPLFEVSQNTTQRKTTKDGVKCTKSHPRFLFKSIAEWIKSGLHSLFSGEERSRDNFTLVQMNIKRF